MVMPMVAPLFLENREFSSTLYMVNELKIPAAAKLTLFDLGGNKIGEDTISFLPNSQQEIGIRGLLDKFHSAAQFGSLREEVLTSNGVGVLAQLSVTHHGGNTSFFDEELLMPSMEGSSTLRAVSDGGRSSIVAITSLSANPQQVVVGCLEENRSLVTKSISLSPNQTTIVRPCSRGEGQNFQGLVSSDFGNNSEDSEQNKSLQSAGISIVSDAMPGEFSAYGLVYHGSDRSAYFSSVNFSDPKMLHSAGLVYAGIPVGDSSLLPKGTYTPRIYLANFADAPADLTVQYASTTGDQPDVQTVLQAKLAGQTARTFELNDLKGDPGLQNSFIVSSNAAPGMVLSKLVARSDGPLRELELIGKDQEQMENSGGHPWSVESGILSTMFLFNHSPQSQEFNVRVADDRTVWLKVYKLASMETRAISINDLITFQVKDDKGKTLPKGMLSGEAGWFSPATTEVSGRILQSDRLQPMARNFSCGTCNFLCGNTQLISDSSLNILVTNQGLLGTITPSYCGLPCQLYTSCPALSNPTNYGPGGVTYSWSGGGSVASLVSGGTSTSATWQGNAVGNTTANFSANMGSYYSCQGTAPITVTPKVTIDSFSPNPIVGGNTASVHISVTPSANITLTINKSGTGSATFGTSGNTSLQIQQTTAVTITGGSESNGGPDLTLQAAYGSSPVIVGYPTGFPFSVTTGACTATYSGHRGEGSKVCPSEVQVSDSYSLKEYCSSCQFSCIAISYDTTFMPGPCSPNSVGGIQGAGNQSLTLVLQGNFTSTDCNSHSVQIQTTVTNAQGTKSVSTGTSIGLNCTAYPNGSLCP